MDKLQFKHSLCFKIFTLTLVFAISVLSSVIIHNTFAHAADFPVGSITIESSQDNVAFDGYQIFNANINNKEEITNVSWTSNDTLKTIIVDFLTERGCSNPENPNIACSFIKDQIKNDSRISGTDIAKSTSFAAVLAQKIATNLPKVDADAEFDANSKETLNQGYWLFVSNNDSISDGKNGSAPIWISVKDGSKTIKEKSGNLNFSKKLFIDGKEVAVTDANIGQKLDFELLVTLPENFEAYPHYNIKISDILPEGMDIVDGVNGFKVYDLAEDITPASDSEIIKMSLDGNIFTAEFVDLTMGSHNFTKDSIIKICYSAYLTPDAIAGGNGNTNLAKITYTNDPASLSTVEGVFPNNKVSVFTYILSAKVIDARKDLEAKPLENTEFTIRKDGTDLYVQADGTLSETPYTFTADSDGVFNAPDLSSGKYVIKQTSLPEGYKEPASDIILSIDPVYKSGKLEKLEASISGGFVPPLIGDWYNNSVEADADTGILSLQICNGPESHLLPSTGLFELAIPVAIAIVLLIVCVVGIHKLRKNK